jgi:HEPN domain-containing protein
MARHWDPPADLREWWLNRARGHLARAQNVTVGTSLEDLCLEAHQAAKHAIYAVMLQQGLRLPEGVSGHLDPHNIKAVLAQLGVPVADPESVSLHQHALKAVLAPRGARLFFPPGALLDDLLQQLEHSGVKFPKYVRQADELTLFGLMQDYPALAGPVTQRQHRRAVRLAESVLRWAERRMGRP